MIIQNFYPVWRWLKNMQPPPCHVPSNIIYKTQDMEITYLTTYGLMVKEVVHIYIYNEILFSHKKPKTILPLLTTQMDLKGIMLSEINQTEKDKHHDTTYR